MNGSIQSSVENSMLWAAYGDALGFISELVLDESGLRKRIGNSHVVGMQPWRRRVGGRFGVELDMPQGCYSDDTQLRLATCRAIRAGSFFDVEAFSKIELPVWLSYALGAGRGTRAAAAGLCRTEVTWATNFFAGDGCRYVGSGGNGAAMRIQPHVWCRRRKDPIDRMLMDVIRNAIVTHGHPHGILGAVFHALMLDGAIENKAVPGPDEWATCLPVLRSLSERMTGDHDLKNLWFPLWAREAGKDFRQVADEIVEEIEHDIRTAGNIRAQNAKPETTYTKLVEELGCRTDERRGTGSKTALLAAVLAWLFRNDPRTGSLVAVNLLGSDTDTIATMAGAIWGAVLQRPPAVEVMDHGYLVLEARRMVGISEGLPIPEFGYPDLLAWTPPKTQADGLGRVNGKLAMAGLGDVQEKSREYPQPKSDYVWQWYELVLGQSVLVRRRANPEALSQRLLPKISVRERREISPTKQLTLPGAGELVTTKIDDDDPLLRSLERAETAEQTATSEPLDSSSAQPKKESVSSPAPSIDDMFNAVMAANFDPRIVGELVLSCAEHKDGIERVVALAVAMISPGFDSRGA